MVCNAIGPRERCSPRRLNAHGWMPSFQSEYVNERSSPSRANAIGQMLGFLVYDLVLIGPFILRYATVEPEYRVSLIVYTILIVYSGVLAAFYLYVRTWVTPLAALLATAMLGTNYVFLNFSRATWMGDGKALGLTCGLLSFPPLVPVQRVIGMPRLRAGAPAILSHRSPTSREAAAVGRWSPGRPSASSLCGGCSNTAASRGTLPYRDQMTTSTPSPGASPDARSDSRAC